MKTTYFKAAPLCTSIIIVSALVTLLLVFLGFMHFHPLLTALCIVILLASLLSMVKGYSIEDNTLIIHRPLWTNKFSLSPSTSTSIEKPGFTLRVFGNGGMFSGTGYFWNKEKGMFRAFITDPKTMIWVNTGSKLLVISPEDKKGFISYIEQNYNN